MQWGTNTTKIQILITLTVHWFIYNTLLILLTKLLNRTERQKKQKKHSGRDTVHSTYPNKISGDQKVEVYVLVLVWL